MTPTEFDTSTACVAPKGATVVPFTVINGGKRPKPAQYSPALKTAIQRLVEVDRVFDDDGKTIRMLTRYMNHLLGAD